MEDKKVKQDSLTEVSEASLLMDLFHRLIMHHAMWFAEVKNRLGDKKAYSVLGEVYNKSFEIQTKRISETLGFDMVDGIPEPLLNLPDETMKKLRESMAINWLANDGIWFQALEFSENMPVAKQCNDSCWGEFSPFEAWSIKRLLNMQEDPGLEGLKQALRYRFYAFVNKQSITEEEKNSFIFSMNDCRVQTARKRKDLDDYPCKSAGIIEYTSFAESIDSRIKTSCIGCPPDKHPDEWFCSWKFSID